MTNRTGRGKRRDPAEWVTCGRPAGRPKIGEEVRCSVPPEQVARLDEIAAARGVKRQDVLREAISHYLASVTGRETTEETDG